MNKYLSPIFLLADTLGIRVEYFIDDAWVAHHNWMPSHDTPTRVVPEDEKAYQRLLEFIPEFYDVIDYKGYPYMVPKSVVVGDVVIFYFGMGMYAQKQIDGTYLDLDFAESRKKYENVSLHIACNKSTFYGKKD